MLEAIPYFYHQPHSGVNANSKVALKDNSALAYRLTLTNPFQIAHHQPYGSLTTTRKQLNAGFTPVMERYFSQIPNPSLLAGINTTASRTLERCTQGLREWLSQDWGEIIISLKSLKSVLDELSAEPVPQKAFLKKIIAIQNFMTIFAKKDGCSIDHIKQGFAYLPNVSKPHVYLLKAYDPSTFQPLDKIQHLALIPSIKQRFLPETELISLDLNQPDTYQSLAERLHNNGIMKSEYAFEQVFYIPGTCDLFELYPTPSMLSLNKIPTPYYVTRCYGLSIDRNHSPLSTFPYIASEILTTFPELFVTYQALTCTMELLCRRLEQKRAGAVPVSDLLTFSAINEQDPINSFIEHVHALIGETRHFAERQFNALTDVAEVPF